MLFRERAIGLSRTQYQGVCFADEPPRLISRVDEREHMSEESQSRTFECPSPGDCDFETDVIDEFTEHINTEHAGEYQRDDWPDTPAGRASRRDHDGGDDENNENSGE